MRVKRAEIDSLNLSGNHLESMFIYNKDYSIETVKSKVVFENEVWRKTFGKCLKRHIVEAKIIHMYRGISLPLKIFAVSPLSQTLEFAGLHGYNNRSEELVIAFNELKSQLQYTRVTRMDIAIDYEGNIPKRIRKALSKARKPFVPKRYPHMTYYKTTREMENKHKSNPYLDIKVYDKSSKENLDYPLERLEFVFKGRYFCGLLLKDLDIIIAKMEKSIKSLTGVTVRINPIIDLKK